MYLKMGDRIFLFFVILCNFFQFFLYQQILQENVRLEDTNFNLEKLYSNCRSEVKSAYTGIRDFQIF
jgi:hypothetical protein